MFEWIYENTKLPREKGGYFYYNKLKIAKLMNEIEKIIIENPFLKEKCFIREQTYNQNNKKQINLEAAHNYIKERKKINQETLKKLYTTIMKELLDDYELENMGEFYRQKNVYISTKKYMSFFEAGTIQMPPDKIEKHMDYLLDYINNSKENSYIKAQIMHFILVYIHPYFNGNGRCGRCLASWYLCNEHLGLYTIFEKGIYQNKRKYIESIKKSIAGDLTYFLEYMIEILKKELEKEIIIYNYDSKGESNYGSRESQPVYQKIKRRE